MDSATPRFDCRPHCKRVLDVLQTEFGVLLGAGMPAADAIEFCNEFPLILSVRASATLPQVAEFLSILRAAHAKHSK